MSNQRSSSNNVYNREYYFPPGSKVTLPQEAIDQLQKAVCEQQMDKPPDEGVYRCDGASDGEQGFPEDLHRKLIETENDLMQLYNARNEFYAKRESKQKSLGDVNKVSNDDRKRAARPTVELQSKRAKLPSQTRRPHVVTIASTNQTATVPRQLTRDSTATSLLSESEQEAIDQLHEAVGEQLILRRTLLSAKRESNEQSIGDIVSNDNTIERAARPQPGECPWCLQKPCPHKADIDFTRDRMNYYFSTKKIWNKKTEFGANAMRRAVFQRIYREHCIHINKPLFAQSIPTCVRATALFVFPLREDYDTDDYSSDSDDEH